MPPEKKLRLSHRQEGSRIVISVFESGIAKEEESDTSRNAEGE